MDKQEAEFRQALAQSEAAQVTREGNLLAITLKGDVTFDTDSTVVRPGLHNEIDRIAQVMVQYPETQIIVQGHTDSTGSESYNMDLSIRRALAVKTDIRFEDQVAAAIDQGVGEFGGKTFHHGCVQVPLALRGASCNPGGGTPQALDLEPGSQG